MCCNAHCCICVDYQYQSVAINPCHKYGVHIFIYLHIYIGILQISSCRKCSCQQSSWLTQTSFLPFHYYTSPLRKKTEVAKHNCSVTDKTESSEICTIGVTRQCRDEKVMLGRVETEEQCFQATKTVCTVNTVNVQAQKCNYQYQPRWPVIALLSLYN